MTVAQFVADHATGGARAVSFEYGYLIAANGNRVLYPPARVLKERRRAKDSRCTYSLCEWPDGSRLEFTYSELTGARFKVR
jgi:hypothetical protein